MAQRTVETDISNSRRAFEELVWPTISKEWFDGADLEPVEEEDDSLKKAMDTIAGVDYWMVGDSLEPIASRVQNGKDISTHTVRMSRNTPGSGDDTEFQKRLQTMEKGGLSPKWAIQAYVAVDEINESGIKHWVIENGKLLNAAMVKEKELIQWCEDGVEGVHFGKNGTGHNADTGEDEDFYYVHWDDYSRFRWFRSIDKVSEQSFAKPLGTQYDPTTKEPMSGQKGLDEFVDRID